MLLATGCFTLVYVLGTALPCGCCRAGRGCGGLRSVALTSVLGLLVTNGWHVAWALGVAAAAVGLPDVERASEGRGRLRP